MKKLQTNEQRLEAIENRERLATAGPWRCGNPEFSCILDHGTRSLAGLLTHPPYAKGCIYQFSGWRENTNEIHVDRDYSQVSYSGDVPRELHQVYSENRIAGTWDYDLGGIEKPKDVDFIAHAREDIPYLLSQVRKGRALAELILNLSNPNSRYPLEDLMDDEQREIVEAAQKLLEED